jgi:pyruvate-ferredoxin/flavodoxin oxidoreductase
MIDGLEYRGTAFFQCYTPCQPEHGIADDKSAHQSKLCRDSRGMPEFVFDPRKGEFFQECFDLKGNPNVKNDWRQAAYAEDKEKYNYTVAHWATSEARFRKHFKAVESGEVGSMLFLDDMLLCVTQADVVNRRVFDESHRSYIPDFGVYIIADVGGRKKHLAVSRQVVLFCVERRKTWRMLQSKAGVENADYQAQIQLLEDADAGKISVEDLRARPREIIAAAAGTSSAEG